MEQLLTLNRYPELCELLSGANGKKDGISNTEILHLSWLGAHVPVGGDIIDVGSHMGKSACAMGSGALQMGNWKARLLLSTCGLRALPTMHTSVLWKLTRLSRGRSHRWAWRRWSGA